MDATYYFSDTNDLSVDLLNYEIYPNQFPFEAPISPIRETTIEKMQEQDNPPTPSLHQEMIFQIDEDFTNLAEEWHPESLSAHLYQSNANFEVLRTRQPVDPFDWDTNLRCYTNLRIDHLRSRLELTPILPWQLLQDPTFKEFCAINTKTAYAVVRLGFEIYFGTVDDFKDGEKKILKWLSHHIYDTTAIVDFHDFIPNTTERRIQTYNAMLKPKKGKSGKATLWWQRGALHSLQSVRL